MLFGRQLRRITSGWRRNFIQLRFKTTYRADNPPPLKPVISGTSGKYGAGDEVELGFPATYNELPQPRGSWEQYHKWQNQKYNKHLMTGVSFFLFTIFVVSRVATFNFYPPPLDEMCFPPDESVTAEDEVDEECNCPPIEECPPDKFDCPVPIKR